jgi:hypothetical protein
MLAHTDSSEKRSGANRELTSRCHAPRDGTFIAGSFVLLMASFEFCIAGCLVLSGRELSYFE